MKLTDASVVSGLTNLKTLSLAVNGLSSLAPLLDNAGLGSGDANDVSQNPFDCAAQANNVAILVGRGAAVTTGCP